MITLTIRLKPTIKLKKILLPIILPNKFSLIFLSYSKAIFLEKVHSALLHILVTILLLTLEVRVHYFLPILPFVKLGEICKLLYTHKS